MLYTVNTMSHSMSMLLDLWSYDLFAPSVTRISFQAASEQMEKHDASLLLWFKDGLE